jgi:hypothetical protein
MRNSLLHVSTAALVALAGSIIHAETVYCDVFVTGSGGRLVIGGYDDAVTTATVPADQMRVFGGEVVPAAAAAPYESASPGEPGFRAATQAFLNNSALTTPSGVFTALPAGTPLAFSFLPTSIGATTRNLFYWNGSGAVDFAPVAGNVSFNLTKQGGGGWTLGITGSSAAVITGTTIQVTSSGASAGTVHTHLFTSIGKDNSTPDQGFYLVSLGLKMNGMVDSDPLYFVYGALDPANLAPQFADLAAFETAHGQAELWVEGNLVAVPEPSSVVLGGLGAAGLGWLGLRRRRAGRGQAPRST